MREVLIFSPPAIVVVVGFTIMCIGSKRKDDCLLSLGNGLFLVGMIAFALVCVFS
jgi:hypothetical protein